MNLDTLISRREKLCLRFALKCVKTESTADMFPLNKSVVNTRHREKYFVHQAKTKRLRKSAIPYMQQLLNKFDKEHSRRPLNSIVLQADTQLNTDNCLFY